MNFFEICKEVARDSGTVAGIPNFTTVAGATGRVAQVVGWVRDAWIDIQNERQDWLWLRERFEAPLTIAQMEYSPAELGITRFAAWIPDRRDWQTMTLHDPELGRADEGAIEMISFDEWRRRFDRGVHDANRPHTWASSPQRKLCVGNKPDKAYVIRGEYRKSAQRLLVDADTPEMPEQFHRLIIAESIRLMARSDEAFQALAAYGEEYVRLRSPLVIDQTPAVSLWP